MVEKEEKDVDEVVSMVRKEVTWLSGYTTSLPSSSFGWSGVYIYRSQRKNFGSRGDEWKKREMINGYESVSISSLVYDKSEREEEGRE